VDGHHPQTRNYGSACAEPRCFSNHLLSRAVRAGGDVAPKFYPALSSLLAFGLPCWAVEAIFHLVERRAWSETLRRRPKGEVQSRRRAAVTADQGVTRKMALSAVRPLGISSQHAIPARYPDPRRVVRTIGCGATVRRVSRARWRYPASAGLHRRSSRVPRSAGRSHLGWER
jgi:hypothetical protein